MDVLKELESLKMVHRDCEDGWYRCPKHPDGCLNDAEGNECNCGAERHNANVDEIIKELSNNGFNMKLALLLSAILTAKAYAPPDITTPPPAPLTLYERAVMGTPVPARLLRAVAIVESGERDDAIGRDGYDKGRMQLREVYHTERADLYGQDYDPHNPVHSTRIAALIIANHYTRFGRWDYALSAYNKGAGGVLSTGLANRYLALIDTAMKTIGGTR